MDRDPLLQEREKTHGSFAETARVAQDLKHNLRHSSMHHLEDVRQLEALDMIATKIGRILSGDPKCKDHWADIAGYAKLGEEACD